jgi:hypothetical protein
MIVPAADLAADVEEHEPRADPPEDQARPAAEREEDREQQLDERRLAVHDGEREDEDPVEAVQDLGEHVLGGERVLRRRRRVESDSNSYHKENDVPSHESDH